MARSKSLGRRATGQVRDQAAEPSVRRFVGRIETIEVGAGFIVATGWATDRSGHPVDAGLTLVVDAVAHPVTGLFPRDDLKAEGLSEEACAFCLDIPQAEDTSPDACVRLLVGDEELWSSDRDDAHRREFRPVASFDGVTSDLVTGWVYDPGLWHGRRDDDPVRLAVGHYPVPVIAGVQRFDLPYSAAREGRFLGFRVALAAELEAHYGADVLDELAGEPSVPVSLTSQGVDMASTTVRLERPVPAIQEGGDPEPDGFVDFHAYSDALDGWLFGGWVRNDALGSAMFVEGLVDLPDGSSGEALLLTYPRIDIETIGQGIVAFVPGAKGQDGASISLSVDDRRLTLQASGTTKALAGLEAVRAVRAILNGMPERSDSALARVVSRPIYEGIDTLPQLSQPIFFEVDEVICGGGEGVMLIGWCVDPAAAVAAIRVRSGRLLSAPLGERWLTVDRPDIRDALGSRFNLDHAGFGFYAYAELPGYDPGQLYIEVTLHNGEVAFKPLPAATRAGRNQIVRILSNLTMTTDTVRQICGRVLGPPVVGINRQRLAGQGAPAVMALGTLPDRPRCSIVVPLYGRIDFMMYQMALMSETGLACDELVYVLDQPERKAEFLTLARSCHRRYAMPARLVLPPENLGFAGASNAGLNAGAGDYVCFLNSDVMPTDADWLDRLVAGMEADPGIGIMGAQLLFEDGTLQHGGMAMKRLPGFGNMPFPYHPGKGRLPVANDGVREVPLVTGALMLMRRSLALDLGGFDTDYVTGDFEDADLCMKVRGRGLRCAVHDGVRLYHLERQSQGSAANAWRQNLTLVNACTFADRWEADLADVPVHDDLVALA